MAMNLKPLYQQVLVVTGATSDIGAATVHMAVEQGAKVFMIDQNEDALQLLQDEMRNKGYDTAYSVADVSLTDQLQFAADQCIGTFGAIDTWANIPVTTDVPEKNYFEVHYWGMVNGCNVAIPLNKERGGVLINVASAYRSEPSPHKHIDSASRQAVKGYTDTLRKDLKESNSQIEVSLVISSDPNVVARSILRCAEMPIKEIGEGKALTERFLPINRSSLDHFGRTMIAAGLGGVAVTGGMLYLMLRKYRLV